MWQLTQIAAYIALIYICIYSNIRIIYPVGVGYERCLGASSFDCVLEEVDLFQVDGISLRIEYALPKLDDVKNGDT